jgi:anti-sigma factor RsiW
MKSCQDVQTFLMDYLDDELPAVESLLFRLHILLCVACRKYMARYKDSTVLAKQILDDPPPPELVNLSVEFLRKRAPSGLKQTAQ